MINNNTLNEKQLEAANHVNGPALILAGAGTGKTTTIAHRIYNLINAGVPPESILLVTFTRKAAEEMRNKVAGLIKNYNISNKIMAGTFHSIAIQLMKQYGLFRNKTIIDKSDEETIIQKIKDLKNNNQITENMKMRNDRIIKFFSFHQSTRIPLYNVLEIYGDEKDMKHFNYLHELLVQYKEYKNNHNLVSFNDILDIFSWQLQQNGDYLKSLQNRFNYIMVDEFQDTNVVQNEIVSIITARSGNLMVVGDDSQSIYSWRGANIDNILNFETRYYNTKVIKLEENYRSTPQILNIVNNVNVAMKEGYKKELYSSKPEHYKPKLVICNSPESEAEYIANKIIYHIENGLRLNDMAVIYNKSDNAKCIEQELVKRGIKYKKIGGLKIAEKAHVKDVLAYLKVLINPADSLAWTRIISFIRGVGEAKLPDIIDGASKYGVENFTRDLSETLSDIVDSTQILFRELSALKTVDSMIMKIIQHTKSIIELRNKDKDKNIFTVFTDLDFLMKLAFGFTDIESFLTTFAMETSNLTGLLETKHTDNDAVILSTIHSVKGLEFNTVFMPHLLNGVFPGKPDENNIAETHRLFYVGVSRAKENLYLSYTTYKPTFGNFAYFEPSSFLSYITFDNLDKEEYISKNFNHFAFNHQPEITEAV